MRVGMLPWASLALHCLVSHTLGGLNWILPKSRLWCQPLRNMAGVIASGPNATLLPRRIWAGTLAAQRGRPRLQRVFKRVT